MLKRYGIFFIVFFCWVYCEPCLGDIFKYYNQNGILCFTNDPSVIPKKQKALTESFQEIKALQGVEKGKTVQESFRGNEIERAGDLEKVAVPVVDDEQARALIQIKKELNSEYEHLNKRRAQLLKESLPEMTSRQTKAFNLKAKELNDSFFKYRQKKDAYNHRVQIYNSTLSQQE